MIETEPVKLPPLTPLQRHQQLEVDAFCPHCGYNLHGQPVTRDERLGIFVCRCPECGRFHPAGAGASAASAWGARLASALLVFWVLFVLHAVFWICMGVGGVAVLHLETFSYRRLLAADGREVLYGPLPAPGGGSTYGVVYKGTTQPAAVNKAVRTPRPLSEYLPPDDWRLPICLGMAALIGLATGVLLVTFLWHWRRSNYLWVLLLPLIVNAVTGLFMATEFGDDYTALRGWMGRWLLAYSVLEAAAIAVGILIGRPIARGLLNMFIPPKPRQHLAFLWRCDGKTPPAATVTAP